MNFLNGPIPNNVINRKNTFYSQKVPNDVGEIAQHIELIRIIKRYEYCHGWTLLIAPDHLPKKDMLIQAGINLDKVLIIHKKHCNDLLFKAYQALRQDNFSALVIWDNLMTDNEVKLLKIKAEYTTTSLYFLNNKAQNQTVIAH